ncbi:unnamed protein product [Echinostoma caproni]|uniref:RNA binding motif protein 14 n=1 Tax=Echinostoma caproni TaxID=27848 RepID=A0A183BE61_9TREM|nr:unnamed protein product [Echinostoma caproni]
MKNLIVKAALSPCEDSGINLFSRGRMSDLDYADKGVLLSEDPGMPDPFTAAVAAAVTGSSAAQAEYYQAYQQYYQQYYASQYAAQFYAASSATDTSTTSAGLTSISGDRGTTTSSSNHESIVQQNAVLDEVASQLYARALQRAHGRGSQEYAPAGVAEAPTSLL